MASSPKDRATEAGSLSPALSGRGPFRQATLPPVVTLLAVAGVLYVGREVFLPIAVALLLTFALAPLVSVLRRTGLPRVVAVIATVATAFLVIAMFSLLVATQVNDLARNVSLYQYNILTKVRTLKEAGASSGIVERISGAIERVGREIERDETPTAAKDQQEPLPVEVVTRPSPIEVLLGLIAPLVSPLATTGLIIVVVIFMLIEREDLRDRFIRLVGYGDLHRTTEALQEAGRRVGQYLRMQLVVNVTYAVPITIGLWLLGIPNAPLWGLLTLVLRFVPYIGPIIGMVLPLFLALAVSPGWYLLLWTALLFAAMELISNNIIEPWLYGSHTGLSPLAIIVAAIFWTWLWGPLGLLLSTPLTVCLAVLGRHVPQFEFLDVLFGNEPVLEPKERLYQRFLAGDSDEATDQAEEILEEDYLIVFYQRIGIPALVLAERDRARGVMTDRQREQVANSALALVTNLEAIAQEEAAEDEASAAGADDETDAGEDRPGYPELPDGAGKSVLCIGGRGELDDAAAAMLAQALAVEGASVSRASFGDIQPTRLGSLDLTGLRTIVIGFLNADSRRHARFLVRRFKRAAPSARVGVVFWSGTNSNRDSEATEEIGADFVAFDIIDAARGALSDDPVEPYRLTRRLVRRTPAGAAAEGKASVSP
jgi:predicted PurR-regulated permease PerM